MEGWVIKGSADFAVVRPKGSNITIKWHFAKFTGFLQWHTQHLSVITSNLPKPEQYQPHLSVGSQPYDFKIGDFAGSGRQLGGATVSLSSLVGHDSLAQTFNGIDLTKTSAQQLWEQVSFMLIRTALTPNDSFLCSRVFTSV